MKKSGLLAALCSCLLLLAGICVLMVPQQASAATISSLTGAENHATVSWQTQKKAKKYIVYRKVNSGEFVKVATLSKKARSYRDSNVQMGETYSYRVAGVVKGVKKTGAAQTVKIVEGGESVQITSLVKNSTSATVYWKKLSNTDHYLIYRKAPGENYKNIGRASASATSFNDKSIKSNVDYTYSVCSVKKLKTAVYYEDKYDSEGVRLISAKPSIKGDFTTLNTTVSWNGIDDDSITGYQVRRKFTKSGSFKTIATLRAPSASSYRDVYHDSMTEDERSKYLTAGYFEDPAMNSLVYTVRAYRTENGKTSYGNYNVQGVMHIEAPTITGVKVYKKKGKKYADVSFSLLRNAKIYKVYGGYTDSKGKHWKLLGSFSPSWKYGDCTKTVKTSDKYNYYTVKAGFTMNNTTVYSKYDTGFNISNRKYGSSNVLFLGDSISFGSPYKGRTTVERFSYPWRVGQLTGCKYFNPSIPGATYTAKYTSDGELNPTRSRIVVEVADRINQGKTPIYNTTKPTSDATGNPVKENVPSYVQYKNKQHFYDFDIIVMAAGTNDWQDNTVIGDIDSVDNTEFCGALNIIMDQITVASQYRVNHGKKPIKVIFTDLYYSDRMMGHFDERNDRFVTENARGYTLVDYQNAIDDIAAKYEGYGMEIWKMPTSKYCNYDNAPYTMSDNLHMTRFTYGQIGNGLVDFMIKNSIFSKSKSNADIGKLMSYVPISERVQDVIEDIEDTSESIDETQEGTTSVPENPSDSNSGDGSEEDDDVQPSADSEDSQE